MVDVRLRLLCLGGLVQCPAVAQSQAREGRAYQGVSLRVLARPRHVYWWHTLPDHARECWHEVVRRRAAHLKIVGDRDALQRYLAEALAYL